LVSLILASIGMLIFWPAQLALQAKVEPNLRLKRLLYRKPESLRKERVLALRRAIEFGEKDDAWTLFDRLDEVTIPPITLV
jgi:hypothetical protein